MGVYFLLFFVTGYFVAGLVIYADRAVARRIHSSFRRKMMRMMLLYLVTVIAVMIVKAGGL